VGPYDAPAVTDTLSIPLTTQRQSFEKPRGRAVLVHADVPAYVAMRSVTGTHSVRLEPGRPELVRLQGYAQQLAAAAINGEGVLGLTGAL